MDLNEIKNRAKDLLADLTDNRPDREERSGPGRADDAVDDSAVRTDRLDRPLDRPAAAGAGDPAPTHEPPSRELPDRSADGDRRSTTEQHEVPAQREVVAQPVERDLDPAPAAASNHLDQPAEPGRHHLRDTGAPLADQDAVDADGLPADPNRLVTAERAQSYGARWDEIKGEFVDEPRQAVAKADALVGELLDELGQLFTQQRRGIEQDLDNDEVSTEDLRVALRRYRSFFDRLLSV